MSELSGHAGRGFLLFAAIFLRDGGFFGEHYGNLVPNRVNAPARNAFQARFVCKQFHAGLAHRANQEVESVFWNDQYFLPGLAHGQSSK